MPSPAQLARLGEWVFATLVLVWLGEAHGRFGHELADRDLFHALFAVCAALLVARRRELRPLLSRAWPVLLPVLVAALSPAWSLDPQQSLRAAVVLEAATVFGLWLALRFDAGEQLIIGRKSCVSGRSEGTFGQVATGWGVEPAAGFFDNNAHLLLLRGDWRFARNWEGSVEGRMLELPDLNDRRAGALFTIYRYLGDHFKVGVGYNFTDFSDDLTDLSYDHHGLFLNLVGTM